ASDGRCKSFSTDADGTGWSEGAGVILVERLSDAQRNNHPVLAIIRGTAVNQDGASNGLTAPNGPAQQRVIRQALTNARLTTTDIDAVEAHGTGTTLGDPIEAQALIATYGHNRPDNQPLYLGTIKSNLGHTQAAAGAAGIIKMVQALRHATLPRTLHITTPTTKVDWTEGNIQLLTETLNWPQHDHPRRAGISSFGVSGTNAHIILEQAPPTTDTPDNTDTQDTPDNTNNTDNTNTQDSTDSTTPQTDTPLPLLLSATTPQALQAQATQLHHHLTTHPDLTIHQTTHTLATTRAHLHHRAALLTTHNDRNTLLQTLQALATNTPHPHLITSTNHQPRYAYLFTGQGAQHPQMGHQLYTTHPTYAQTLDTICDHLDPHLDHPLRDILFAHPDTHHATLLNQTLYTQTATFALQIALHRLLEHHNLHPHALTGHSIGELAAAHAAGILTLQDACTLIATRARLMQNLPTGGTMIAIQATEEEITPHLTNHTHHASIAAINTPDNLVISGDTTTITTIANHFANQGRTTKQLPVSHAFHSPLMHPILDDFHKVAQTLTYHHPTTPLISTVTGTIPDNPDHWTNPTYWTNQIHQPVRFHQALQTLHTQNITHTIEIGPHPTLTNHATTTLPNHTHTHTLRRNQPENHTLHTTLAHAHTNGIPITWTNHHPTTPTPLPTYPFQHQHYWLQ
ncbi:type I polyketide synthase, partial [Kitasatospora sp. NPDC008050]|uniref:type I polyketide synthase n=1 Tax=Kitasatospora sp. NPDC008050 TaxID=3364021 RepID=UPI0036E9E2C7